MGRVIDEVDVICQYKYTGEMIPIRFRIMNEDGIYQCFTVKGYRELKWKGSVRTSDGLPVGAKDRVFECRIIILNLYKTVRLYYNSERLKWRLAT